MAYKQPDSFLSGLASGLGGTDMQTMAKRTRELDQKTKADLIGNLRSNNLISFGPDGVEVSDEFYTDPMYSELRKQVINSGGKALFKYYEKDGSVRQGAFDGDIPVDDDNVALATVQEDGKTPGVKTVSQTTEKDDDVALMPKEYLDRTTKVILNSILQKAAPGYGQEFGLQQEMLKRERGQTDRQLSLEEKRYQEAIQPLLDERKRLEEELAKVANEGEDPNETADKAITLNEEIDRVESEIADKGKGGVPVSITHRDSGDALSEGVLKRMKEHGMSGEQVQAEVSRNDAVVGRANELKGSFIGNARAARIKNKSKVMGDVTVTKNRYLNQTGQKKGVTRREHLAELQNRIDNGETLNSTDQKAYDKYQTKINGYDEKLAQNQGDIDTIFMKAENSKLAGGSAPNADWEPPTGTKEPWVTDVVAEKVLTDKINDEKGNPELERLNAINEKLLIAKNNWNSARDVITAKGNYDEQSIVMMGMAKRLAQAAGVDPNQVADWAVAYYGGMENARVTGNPLISELDRDKHLLSAEKFKQTVRSFNANREKLQIEMGWKSDEFSGKLFEGLVDEYGNLLRPKDSPKFRATFGEIDARWRTIKEQRARTDPNDPDSLAWGTAGNAAQNAYEQSLGLAILGAAYEKSENSDIFDNLPTGNPASRWWRAMWREEAGDSAVLGGIINNIRYDAATGRVTVDWKGAEASEYLTTAELQGVFGDNLSEVLDYLENKEDYIRQRKGR